MIILYFTVDTVNWLECEYYSLNYKIMYLGIFLQILIQRCIKRGTIKGKRTSSADARRQSILSTIQGRPADMDMDDYTPRSKAKRRQSLRDSNRKYGDQKWDIDEQDEEIVDERNIENYWFFVNRWFARSEDDGAIIRELLPTDETGKSLAGSLKRKSHL